MKTSSRFLLDITKDQQLFCTYTFQKNVSNFTRIEISAPWLAKYLLPDWRNTSSVTVPDKLSSKGHRSRFEITDWLISIPLFYTLDSLPEITKDTQNQAVLHIRFIPKLYISLQTSTNNCSIFLSLEKEFPSHLWSFSKSLWNEYLPLLLQSLVVL